MKQLIFMELTVISLIYLSLDQKLISLIKTFIINDNSIFVFFFFHYMISNFFCNCLAHNTFYFKLYVPPSRPEQRYVHSISCVKWHSKHSGDRNIDILELRRKL